MDFEEYLVNRHMIQPKAKRLSGVSIEQYVNRFHNLERLGIYNGEREITENILTEIEKYYKNGLKHYPRTITYYIEYVTYIENEIWIVMNQKTINLFELTQEKPESIY